MIDAYYAAFMSGSDSPPCFTLSLPVQTPSITTATTHSKHTSNYKHMNTS